MRTTGNTKREAAPSPAREGTVCCISPGGLHRMAYVEWGARDNPRVLLCAHGLTRNGRDFDTLAQALAGEFRVICPDVVGRGQSDWLAEPAHYDLRQYVSDMVTLIARLDVEAVYWLGTSMGGLIGMALASIERSPIDRLVLNDVGPEIAPDSLRRIGETLGQVLCFSSLDEAEAFIRRSGASFGALTDAQWRRLTETSVRPEGGGWTMRYDPRIAEGYRRATAEVDYAGLWAMYDRIRCPTRVIRGAQSDLLSVEAAHAMSVRGPRPRIVEIPGIGHAPMFTDDGQIGLVREFLLAPEEKK